jgi:hypothetical protein
VAFDVNQAADDGDVIVGIVLGKDSSWQVKLTA